MTYGYKKEMKSAKEVYTDIEQEITNIAGDDWNNRRTRVYILAGIAEYKKSVHVLETELAFEKKVSQRLNEIVKSWFDLKRNNDE